MSMRNEITKKDGSSRLFWNFAIFKLQKSKFFYWNIDEYDELWCIMMNFSYFTIIDNELYNTIKLLIPSFRTN